MSEVFDVSWYYVKCIFLSLVGVVLYYGSRYLMGIYTGTAEYLLDSSIAPKRRIAHFLGLVFMVFALLVGVTLVKGRIPWLQVFEHGANGNMSRDDGKNADFFYDIYGQLDTIHFDAYGYADTTISFGYNTSGERVYKNYVRNYKDSCGGGGGIPQNMNSGSGPEELGAGTMGLGPGGPPPRDTLCDFRDSTYTLYVRSNGKVLAEYGVGRYIPQRKYIYAGDTRNKTTGCSVFIFELVDKDWE